MKSITPRDIRNPARKSGYNYVNTNQSNSWRAASGSKGSPSLWRGPTRRTPEQAAQDYCDYINGNSLRPAGLPAYPQVTIDMGNTKRHAPKSEKIKVIRRKHVGHHDLYDVLFVSANGDVVCRKIGITARGHARYADVCRTLGMSIRPRTRAVTFPTEEAARVAEAAKIAEVAADPAWRRVGKESFAPTSLRRGAAGAQGGT